MPSAISSGRTASTSDSISGVISTFSALPPSSLTNSSMRASSAGSARSITTSNSETAIFMPSSG